MMDKTRSSLRNRGDRPVARSRLAQRSPMMLVALAMAASAGGPGSASAQEPVQVPDRNEAERRSEARSEGPERPENGKAAADASDWQPVVYVPRSRGQAQNTAAGGTRTTRSRNVDARVRVLAPGDHAALTSRAQPTLYWFLSADTDQRIDITLVDDEAIDPLLEVTLPGPVHAGIHALVLSDLGLSLELGKTYHFYVSIVRDPKRRSADLLAEASIERIAASDALERELAGAERAYEPYARRGVWYDAMDAALSAVAAEPDDSRHARQRAALLGQAGLGEVATYAGQAER